MATNTNSNDVVDMNNALLEHARQRAKLLPVSFAGLVYPQEAWTLVCSGAGLLIDVRTDEELRSVGRVPETPHVAWRTGQKMVQNPQFVQQIEAIAPKDAVVLLLCRSGVRSAAAAESLAQVGYINVFNVLEGFEGELDNHQQRGTYNGWRFANLPWVRD